MKQIKTYIKNYLTKLKDKLYLYRLRKNYLGDIGIEVFYTSISENEKLLTYLYKKLNNIIEHDLHIPIYVCDTIKDGECAGLYTCINRDSKLKEEYSYEKLKTKYKNLSFSDFKEDKAIYPNIKILSSLDKLSRLFVLAHELCHHLIEVRGLEQSEELADALVLDVFREYFGEVYCGIFHTMLSVKLKDLYKNVSENEKDGYTIIENYPTIKNKILGDVPSFIEHYIKYYIPFIKEVKTTIDIDLPLYKIGS